MEVQNKGYFAKKNRNPDDESISKTDNQRKYSGRPQVEKTY